MKKEKGNILIIVVLTLLIALLVGLVIYWSKSQSNVEKLIIEAIKEDRKAEGAELVLYAPPVKMKKEKEYFKNEDNNCDYYIVTIMDNDERIIDYDIVIENNKVIWCEEITNEQP